MSNLQMSSKTFYMLVGLPASGKSTIAKELHAENKNSAYFSSDDTRCEFNLQDGNNTDNAKLFSILRQRCKEALVLGKDVYFDATNLSRKKRKGFLSDMNKYANKKVCLLVLKPYELCVEHDALRSRSVGRDTLFRMYKNFQVPWYTEGFDEIKLLYTIVGTSSFYGNTLDVLATLDSIDIPHDSPYHKESVGAHIKAAYALALNRAEFGHVLKPCLTEYNTVNTHILTELALLHDIGKFKTKSFISDKNGSKLDHAHFHGHENASAYDSLFYTTNIPSCTLEENEHNKLLRALLINLHMQMHTANSLSDSSKPKAILKLKRIIADDQIYKILEDFALIDGRARVADYDFISGCLAISTLEG